MNTPINIRKLIIDEIPRLRRYARSLCMNTEDADDLVQNCLERALSRVSYFQAGTNLKAWLLTIMHNIHVNNLKSTGRSPTMTEFNDDHGTSSSAPEWPQRLSIRDLGSALSKLSPEHREAVLLVGMEQYSYRDAANIAGISIGTLMSRLHRARHQLTRLMFEENRPDIRRVK